MKPILSCALYRQVNFEYKERESDSSKRGALGNRNYKEKRERKVGSDEEKREREKVGKRDRSVNSKSFIRLKLKVLAREAER